MSRDLRPPSPRANAVRRGREQGYTLIELLVVIIIIGIVSAISFPSFREMINSNRLTGAANELIASLQIARSEAVRRNARVVICPSTNGTACGGTNWGRHISFVDANRDGAADGALVLRDTTIDAPLQLLGSPAVTAADRIVFRSDGRARANVTADAAILAGKISVCLATTRPVANIRDVQIGSGSRISVVSRSGAGACTAPTNT
ncbi:GspH/FimT family pseudopilin [Arenimonas sp.]|uniref:GspH/FimT family pseudopilin n=1 Tax=Arenimonas sp. TaxID=1872635 RepID=UPI002E2F4B11|nr:GspH/FimT family pseudopilin [Arenimonas sp.]HEX4853019.1 GspH/FimT family pseudopilin [Arenimonas sp.]